MIQVLIGTTGATCNARRRPGLCRTARLLQSRRYIKQKNAKTLSHVQTNTYVTCVELPRWLYCNWKTHLQQ